MSIPSSVLDGDYIDSIAMTVGAEDANVITVAVYLQQTRGGAPNVVSPLVIYIAEAANGLVLEVPGGGVAAGTRGTVTNLVTNGSISTVVPDANGFVDVAVTQSGVDTLFLILVEPDGTITASGALSFT